MNYSLRASHYHKAAIKQYLNAARSDINYLNHSHWWAEIAGCFFLIGKYKWSEKCYRKAISLNELYIPVKALLADALFYQGKFEEAFQEIDKYITDTKYPVCEYKLKKYIFDFFKDNFTDRSRGIDKAIILVDRAISISNPKETLSLLEEAIECDPLCGLAWYNYSVTVSESNKSDSWWFWLITVVLQNWDIESWICLYVYMFL
jgi:tetratricopeptide (TPR) repeat protein